MRGVASVASRQGSGWTGFSASRNPRFSNHQNRLNSCSVITLLLIRSVVLAKRGQDLSRRRHSYGKACSQHEAGRLDFRQLPREARRAESFAEEIGQLFCY
jgi:hypothetical protein